MGEVDAGCERLVSNDIVERGARETLDTDTIKLVMLVEQVVDEQRAGPSSRSFSPTRRFVRLYAAMSTYCPQALYGDGESKEYLRPGRSSPPAR